MSEEIPGTAAADQARRKKGEPVRNGHEKLPREHEEDRSPADPHDWQDEWDRARWAP